MPPQTPAIILLLDRVSLPARLRAHGFPPWYTTLFCSVSCSVTRTSRAGSHLLLELPPDADGDVLRRRIDARQEVHVEIEVPPVHPADDVLLDRRLESARSPSRSRSPGRSPPRPSLPGRTCARARCGLLHLSKTRRLLSSSQSSRWSRCAAEKWESETRRTFMPRF